VDSERSRADRLEADLDRTADRLRGLGLARLAAAFEPEPTRADAARGVAQRLADLAAELAGEPRLTVPRLGDHAVGDQVAVCGRELLDAARAHPSDAADRSLDEAAALVLDLRRRL
jgi:hypothetical protein